MKIRRPVRLLLLFLVLYAPAMVLCATGVFRHGLCYPDFAAALIYATACIIFMGSLRLSSLSRRHHEVRRPDLGRRVRLWLMTVRITIVTIGTCIVIVAGRGHLSFWTLVAVIEAELLTVYAAQRIREKKMTDLIASPIFLNHNDTTGSHGTGR